MFISTERVNKFVLNDYDLHLHKSDIISNNKINFW